MFKLKKNFLYSFLNAKKPSYCPSCSCRAPDGCLQYHTTVTGRLKTFNFDNMNENHINNQQYCNSFGIKRRCETLFTSLYDRYSICIRPCAGFCCVQYQVCQVFWQKTLKNPRSSSCCLVLDLRRTSPCPSRSTPLRGSPRPWRTTTASLSTTLGSPVSFFLLQDATNKLCVPLHWTAKYFCVNFFYITTKRSEQFAITIKPLQYISLDFVLHNWWRAMTSHPSKFDQSEDKICSGSV